MTSTIDLEIAYASGAADDADAMPAADSRSTPDPYDSVLEDIATADGMPERRTDRVADG